MRVVNVGCSVARVGRVRIGLVSTGRGTRRTSRLGDTFLTGVDRRVHAPLGTVINFSKLLIRARSIRRHGRCVNVIRRGGRLLLRLVSSVLSLSGVRTNAFRFAVARIGMGLLYRSVMHDVRKGAARAMELMFSGRLPRYCVVDSHGHLRRIVSGFIGGTTGFASRKAVGMKCRRLRSDEVHFCISSANVKVGRRCQMRVFSHFIGLGSFVRNANLKLSVYQDVVSRLRNRVKIRSRPNGNSYF